VVVDQGSDWARRRSQEWCGPKRATPTARDHGIRQPGGGAALEQPWSARYSRASSGKIAGCRGRQHDEGADEACAGRLHVLRSNAVAADLTAAFHCRLAMPRGKRPAAPPDGPGNRIAAVGTRVESPPRAFQGRVGTRSLGALPRAPDGAARATQRPFRCGLDSGDPDGRAICQRHTGAHASRPLDSATPERARASWSTLLSPRLRLLTRVRPER
jgi:hypothetical protein